MRRMYSEQELTNVIKKVFEEELESGALDELVSDAVDAYLVEHPVDVTALEGQDVELNSLDADGLITGGEIVEKMSGYSAQITTQSGWTKNPVYVGAVKSGNKITFVTAIELTKTDGGASTYPNLAKILCPEEILNKLYPFSNSVLYAEKTLCFASDDTQEVDGYVEKESVDTSFGIFENNKFTLNKTYYVRIEATFLLSDSLVSA